MRAERADVSRLGDFGGGHFKVCLHGSLDSAQRTSGRLAILGSPRTGESFAWSFGPAAFAGGGLHGEIAVPGERRVHVRHPDDHADSRKSAREVDGDHINSASVLADFIQGSLMLRYNQRQVG